MLIAALLAGCAKPDAPAATTATLKAAPAEAGGAAKTFHLAGVVFQEDMFFQLVLLGMRDAAKAAGSEIKTASCSGKPDKEAELINTYIADKVDAIVISAVNPEGSVAALKQAHDAGIKVITCNTELKADFPEAYVECSPANLGEQTGQAAKAYIEGKLGGKANIAVLQFKSQLADQSLARVGGFQKQLEGLAGVKFVTDQDAWLADKAQDKARDILTQHPEVNVIYAANEGGTVGAVQAVKNAGKTGKVVVFGTDASDQLLDFLQDPDNILQAITSQKPYDIGKLAVEDALKVLAGQPVEKKTVLDGILLSRAEPDGIITFAAQYKQWQAGLSGK
jgi:simple sugar transport system substrate-binding protein/ribose transport system substrate-binding protein